MSLREMENPSKLLKFKRDEYRVEIRKRNVEEIFMHKRLYEAAGVDPNANLTEKQRQEGIQKAVQELYKLYVNRNWEELAKVLHTLRGLITVKINPPFDFLIKTGGVPYLLELLDQKYASFPQIHFETAWIVTNLASGDPTAVEKLLEGQVIEKFIAILSTTTDCQLRETIMWGLSNIAGDKVFYRDEMLNRGLVDIILTMLTQGPYDQKLLQLSIWLISNICRGPPHPKPEQIMKLMPLVSQTILMDEEELLSDVCWTISYMTDSHSSFKQKVIDYKLVPRLCKLLLHRNLRIKIPALRTLGNLANSMDEHTTILIENHILQNLSYVLECDNFLIRREVCWCISNISAGTSKHIEAILATDIFAKLLKINQVDDPMVVKEALIALSNLCMKADSAQIEVMALNGIIEAFCHHFVGEEPIFIMTALEALHTLLRKCEGICGPNVPNPITVFMEQRDMLRCFEHLQNSQNQKIYQKTQDMIQAYFQFTEEVNNNPN